jgi:hypothetical protein
MSAMPNFLESSALMLFLYSLSLTSTKPETKLSMFNRRWEKQYYVLILKTQGIAVTLLASKVFSGIVKA